MADANSVLKVLNGQDEKDKWLSWRLVHFLREAEIGDVDEGDTAEGPNDSGSIFDQVTTLAKILTRRYKGKDIWDMVAEMHDYILADQPKA